MTVRDKISGVNKCLISSQWIPVVVVKMAIPLYIV